MTYSQIYDHLLDRVRKEVSVYHRHLGMNLDGFYDVEYNHIVICSRLRNTKRGVRALAHEYTHFKDRHAKRFAGFFAVHRKKYTKERMSEVIAAEQSAGIGAAKICKEYGKKYNPEELNHRKLPNLIKFWETYYLEK